MPSRSLPAATPVTEAAPSLGHLLLNLRAQARNSDQHRYVVCAQTLVTGAVRKYWTVLSPTLPIKEPPFVTRIDLPDALRAAAAHFGESAA